MIFLHFPIKLNDFQIDTTFLEWLGFWRILEILWRFLESLVRFLLSARVVQNTLVVLMPYISISNLYAIWKAQACSRMRFVLVFLLSSILLVKRKTSWLFSQRLILYTYTYIRQRKVFFENSPLCQNRPPSPLWREVLSLKFTKLFES